MSQKGGGNGKESKSNIFDVLLVLQKEPELFEILLKFKQIELSSKLILYIFYKDFILSLSN